MARLLPCEWQCPVVGRMDELVIYLWRVKEGLNLDDLSQKILTGVVPWWFELASPYKVLKMESNNEGRPATIRGLVAPVAWDDKGNVLAAAISTHFEEEYLIEQNGWGEALLALLRQKVKVSGLVMENESGKKVITVKNYEVFEE